LKTSFKVEIQPTAAQRRSLLQHAGNARWAFNWGLSRKKEAWEIRRTAIVADGVDVKDAPKVPTAIDLHRELNVLKKTTIPWMYNASKCAPQEALRNLDTAFQNFFRRCKTGEKPGYPRFKSRNRGIGGFRLTGTIRANHHSLRLPTLGRVRIKPGDHGYIPTLKYGQATVSEKADRWYVSVLGVETEEATPNGLPSIGVDLGVARLATLSNGKVIENPKALAAGAKRLRRAQQSLSRKKKGSFNRGRARAKVARVHAQIGNLREDALHKATTFLAKNHGVIVIEDLQVKNMVKKGNRKRGLNRVLHDASFGEFRRQLEYKAKLYGARVVAVPAAYTSQRCSCCGHVEAANRPSQAAFCCLSCGHAANADHNAAINILLAGSCPESQNACGADVRRGGLTAATQPAVKQESAVA
jgi:putative transposase